jgi:hypothetical protein
MSALVAGLIQKLQDCLIPYAARLRTELGALPSLDFESIKKFFGLVSIGSPSAFLQRLPSEQRLGSRPDNVTLGKSSYRASIV